MDTLYLKLSQILILVRSFESVSVSVTMAVTVFMNLLIAAALVQALYPIQLDVV